MTITTKYEVGDVVKIRMIPPNKIGIKHVETIAIIEGIRFYDGQELMYTAHVMGMTSMGMLPQEIAVNESDIICKYIPEGK